MRSHAQFLGQVEEELRTSAAGLSHDRETGRSFNHSDDCRKCGLVSLADEAADRHALLGDTVGRR